MRKKILLAACVVSMLFLAMMLTGLEYKERYPAIRNAVKSLEAAKVELRSASHDFGGHRAEALEAVDNAIRELNQILEGPPPQEPTPKPNRPR